MRTTQIALCRLMEAGGQLQEMLGRWSHDRQRQLRGICRQALARADRQLLEGRPGGAALVLPLRMSRPVADPVARRRLP